MPTSAVIPRIQFFSNGGKPLVGGRIHTYAAGSSTPATTYRDATRAEPNPNPIILDARGEASIYLAEGVEYKMVIEDRFGALIQTQEPVYGAVWPNAEKWPSDTTLSYRYMAESKAAAGAVGPIRFFDSYANALANAATLADNELAEVAYDETRGSARTRYKRSGSGGLDFVVNLDQVRLDLANDADGALGAAMVGGLIARDMTINVPGQYPSIADAMDYLRKRTIAKGVTVTVQVADGVHELTRTASLNHPQGWQIKVLGNVSAPGQCTLRGPSPPTFDALVCDGGHALGLLDGFTIDLETKAELANNHTAVLANYGSTIICGENIRTRNWYYGIAARKGSTVKCNKCQVENAGDVGIWAFCGSFVSAREAKASGVADAANSWGYGFQAEYGSSLDCTGATASGCLVAGFAALSNSQLRAYDTKAFTNDGSGFLARDGGGIICHGAASAQNKRYGMELLSGGQIAGERVAFAENTKGSYSGHAYFDNTPDLGARIAAIGPLRVDANGGDPIYFNTEGGLQFAIRHADTAVSHFYTQGGNDASSRQPILGVDGNAADVPFRTQAKGAASHYFNSGRGLQFEIGSTHQPAANWLKATGGANGQPVTLEASGNDATVDIQIFPKGNGSYVRLGTGWFSAPGAVADGYCLIKDADGVVRKLLTTA